MATITPQLPRFIGNERSGGHPIIRGGVNEDYIQEAAGQTYKAGDFVTPSSGQIAIAGTGTVNSVANVLNVPVLGIALKAAGGVQGAYAAYQQIDGDSWLAMSVYHSTEASAVTALAQLFTKRQIIRRNGIWYVDIENAVQAASEHVEIVGFMGDPNTGIVNIGDVYGVVKVRVLPLYYSSGLQLGIAGAG